MVRISTNHTFSNSPSNRTFDAPQKATKAKEAYSSHRSFWISWCRYVIECFNVVFNIYNDSLGKTTTLNALLQNTQGLKIAIIVNDMSEVNIDEKLIARVEEKVVALSNGCICCTLREDLLKTVAQIADSHAFDYLVIESSGEHMAYSYDPKVYIFND
jgi:methionine aminopeptidase